MAKAPVATAPASDKAAKVAPLTKDQFHAGAKPLMVKLGDTSQVANLKDFASGSYGWYAGDKSTQLIDVDGSGVPVPCTVSLSIVVIGSKPK